MEMPARPFRPRLHQLDQKLRILERKLELEQEKQTEAVKTTPVTGRGPRRVPGCGPADNSFQLRLARPRPVRRSLLLEDSHRSGRRYVLLRRVRPIVEGTVFKFFDFRLTPDFGGGTTVLQDAYVDLRFRPFVKLRVGKQKQPFGVERLVSAECVALRRARAADRGRREPRHRRWCFTATS